MVSFWQTVQWHILEQKSSHCVLIEVPQYTCQAMTVIGSSFTPSVALLVHHSGTVHLTLDCHEFKRSQI